MIEIMRFQSKRLDKIDIILLEIIMGINFVLFGKYAMVKADTVPDAQQMLNQNATTTMSGVSRSNTIMPIAASSESITHSGVNGTANWDIDSDGKLTVHAGHLAYGRGNWAPYANLITSVYVEPGVTPYSSVMGAGGNGIFSGLSNVEIIDVTNLDVSKAYSLSGMFYNDMKLKRILGLDTWNTSQCIYMGSMFYNDYLLEELDVSSFDTSKATDMAIMFLDCKSLKSLDVSNFDTSGVQSMSSMFSGVSGEIFGLNNFNTSRVTSLRNTFEKVDFTKTNVNDIAGWDTSKVTSMSGTFQGAKFNSLDLSSWDIGNVTDMSNMFANSVGDINQIKNIVDWDVSKVTSMFQMFQGVKNASLSVVDNWDVSSVTNMTGMFQNCSNLSSLDLSKWRTSSLLEVSQMFSGAKLLDENNLKGYQTLVTNKVTKMDSMFSNTGFKEINLSKYDTSNVVDFNHLFYQTTKLNKVIGNLDTHSATNFSYMFDGTGDIDFTESNADKWDTANVTNMSNTFASSKITDYSFLKDWDTSSVIDLSNTFSNIVAQSLPIDKWDVSKVENLNQTFKGTTKLDDLSISKWDVSNITDMSGTFWGSGMKSMDIKNWNTSKVTTFYAMFNSMPNLETLDLSNLDTTSATDVQYMFGGTYKLWKVTLGPKSVLVNLKGPAQPVGSGLGRPVPGTIISDSNSEGTYQAISDKWQEVAPEEGGTDHAPVGDLMSNTDIVDKFSTVGNPVTTYVWQQQPQIDMKMSVPDIDFGETYDSAGLVKRNAPFAINVTNNSYPTDAIPAKINVSMDHPLTDVDDTSKTLNDVLVFKGQDNIEKILSSADTEIYNGDIANGSNDLSWDDDHGILLDMNNDRYAKNGHYTTTLKWTLTNSI